LLLGRQRAFPGAFFYRHRSVLGGG
jgi:hypothetical protein